MDTFANMSMEMNIGDNPFEEDDLFGDTAERTEEGALDGFLPVTGSIPGSPFENGAEQPGSLPIRGETAKAGKPVGAAEENIHPEEDADEAEENVCPEEDAGEGEEPKEKETDAVDSAAEREMEDKKRAEHEAAEARRKAEWEARQQAKKEAEQAQLARMSSLSDEEVTAEAMKRVGTDTERLTRRNMKECVSEYIQTLCLEDPAFARLTMHPRKTMIHCFHYINRKAREFVEQEMKDNDIKPENGVYGSDVPDGLCYQWAEEYFRDPDAKEDRQEEEKFVPKAYSGKSSARSKSTKSAAGKAAGKEKSGKKPEKKPQEKAADKGQFEQMTLAGLAG